MFEIRACPAQFAQLAESLGAKPDPLAHMGKRPAYIDQLPVNDNLTGPKPPSRPLDMDAVAGAAHALPPALTRDRDPWLNYVIMPLAHAAARDPEYEPALRALMHAVSSRPGAFRGDYHRDGNDATWDNIVASTARGIEANRPGMITLGSLFEEAKRHGWQRPAAEVSIAARTATSAASPALDIDAHRLSNRPVVPYKRRPVHGGLGYRGEVTGLVAKGGQAKSTLATVAALAVATGTDLLGIPSGPSLPVAMINAEDKSAEVRLRFEAAADHHNITLPDNIFIYGAEDVSDLQLTEISPVTRKEVVSETGLRSLRAILMASGAKLAFLDPLVALIPYGMNDNGVGGGVMKGLKSIADELDCAIVIIAHTRKGGDVDLQGAEITAGAAAITNLMRGVVTLRTPADKVCREIGVMLGDEKNIREIVSAKANLAPLSDRQFFRLEGVRVANGTAEYPDDDWVAVAEPFKPRTAAIVAAQIPDATLRLAVEAIARGSAGGISLSPAPQAGDARKYVLALQKALGPAYGQGAPEAPPSFADAVFREIAARGWIAVRNGMPTHSKNTGKGLVALWSQTPWAAEPRPGTHVE